jgi:hypothetical protein
MNTDTRNFECQASDIGAAGTVSLETSDYYKVSVNVGGRFFKFAMVRKGTQWATNMLSVFDGRGKLHSVDAFPLTNRNICYLFQDALTHLAAYEQGPDLVA